VFIKRVSGSGTFSLSSERVAYCGNGTLDPGELCDPTVADGAACCSASCLPLAPNTLCDDGNACTTADHCLAGKCAGDPLLCPLPSGDCQVASSCEPATGQCSPAALVLDGTACSIGSCQAGACVAVEAGGASDGGDGGDSGAAGAVARSDGGAAGQLATGIGAEPNSITAGNAGTNGRHPSTIVETDPGCGCSAAGAGQRLGSAFWIAAALGLFGARRRRADSACKRTVRH